LEDVSLVAQSEESLVTSEGLDISIAAEFVKFPAHHAFADPVDQEHLKFMKLMNTRGNWDVEVKEDSEIKDTEVKKKDSENKKDTKVQKDPEVKKENEKMRD